MQTSREVLLWKWLVRIELDKGPGSDRRQASGNCGFLHTCLLGAAAAMIVAQSS